MTKEEKALKKVKALLTKHWESNDKILKRVVKSDKSTQVLNTPARKILKTYLDRFTKLAGSPTEVKTLKELDVLLDSLEYLMKVLLKIAKKKGTML